MDILKKIVIFLIISFKLLLYIVNKTISSSSLLIILYILFIIILSLPFILRIKFTKESFIKISLILLVSFIMFFLYKEDNIFLYSLLGLILIDEDNKDIIKIIFSSLLIIFSITLILGIIGILPNNDVIRTVDGVAQIRSSLGFSNANAVFAYFIPIVLSGIYLYKKNKLFNFMVLIISFILYYYTKCRTGFYLVLLSLIFNIFNSGKTIKKSNIFFIAFFIISILLAVLFGITKYNYVNELLSYRPWFSYQFLKEGIFIWGMGVPENIILDNLYLRLLANYSIVGVFLYLYIYNKGSKICKKDNMLIYVLFFFLLYNVFEAITVGNFVLIIFLKEIFNSFGVVYEKN